MQLLRFFTFVLMSSLLLFSCNDDVVDDKSKSVGSLRIELTDAPFPTDLVSEANVTINKIEIRKNEGTDSSSFITLKEEEMSFNLLDLTNGVTANLVNLELGVGSYDLIRLYVTDASVKLSDGSLFDLKVPSGAQTGIKIFMDPSIEVVGGLTSELLLDFDVSKSFVMQGNMDSPAGIKGFLFTPSIKASNLSSTGSLTGTVSDTLQAAIDGAQVSLIAADTVYISSFSDESGSYAILGVDAGIYNVQFEKEGYEVFVKENVEIVAGNNIKENAELSAI